MEVNRWCRQTCFLGLELLQSVLQLRDLLGEAFREAVKLHALSVRAAVQVSASSRFPARHKSSYGPMQHMQQQHEARGWLV